MMSTTDTTQACQSIPFVWDPPSFQPILPHDVIKLLQQRENELQFKKYTFLGFFSSWDIYMYFQSQICRKMVQR